MTSTETPPTVRALDTPAAKALADLAAMFEDMQTVLRCCERLVTELAYPPNEAHQLLIEALWTTTVLSYTRCFATGRRGMGLTEADVSDSKLEGEVLEWHKILRKLRKHYADPAENPRERFSVGAAQDSTGRPAGIAITSTRQPPLDEVTVRQTGALAYELSQLIDKRIAEHQEKVRTAAEALSTEYLNKLPIIDLAGLEPGPKPD